MRLGALQGDDVNREARQIANGIAKFIEPDIRRLMAQYGDPMAAAALIVHGLLIAAGDGVGTQAAACRIAWTPDDVRELHNDLQTAVHKAMVKIHARTTGGEN